MSISDFNQDFFEGKIGNLNPGLKIIKLSCKTGKNMDKWIRWLVEHCKDKGN